MVPGTSMPYALARNRPPITRIMQVPSILTVDPRGMEKLLTFGEMPSFSVQHFIFMGIAAELDDSIKLVIIPSRYFL